MQVSSVLQVTRTRWKMRDLRRRIKDTRCKIQDARYKIQDATYRIQDAGRMQDAGYRFAELICALLPLGGGRAVR
jgi:hypothetical protein